MDRQVTCPSCHERQTLPGPDGYTCVKCGAAWHLVVCVSCGKRFHMRPETEAWNCPSCGTMNDATIRSTPPTAAPVSPRRSGPAFGGRGPMIAILAGVLLLIVVIWALFMRNDDGSTPASPTRTSSPSAADTLAHLCTDVTPDMPLRVDSVRRTEEEVRADGKALKQEGNTEAAKAAKDLAVALEQLAVALDTQGDTLTANQQMQDALQALPCSST